MNMTRTSRLWLWFGMVLTGCVGLAYAAQESSPELKKPTIFEIGEYVHINASGERPLLQAIDALQSKYGWTVDYEDPQYLSAPGINLSRPSPPNRRHANSSGRSENGFSVQIKIGPASNLSPDVASVLSTVVTAYNQSNGAGEFKLLKESAGRFSVVGIGARNSEGQIQSQQPILDLPISVAKKERNEGETIAVICQALTEQSKIPVSTDTPGNAWEAAKLAIVGQIYRQGTCLWRH